MCISEGLLHVCISSMNITNSNVNLEVDSMYDLYLEVFCLFLRTMQYVFDILVWRVFNDSSLHQSSQKVNWTHTKLLWENGFGVKWTFIYIHVLLFIGRPKTHSVKVFILRAYKTRYSHARQGDNPLLLTRTVSWMPQGW